ncbi:minor capsid protein [Eubacterium limosum]|uniref:minor capsid protein n=1 Tax=Eubacterium limosum TaxID=1736 RepID=UPI001062B845|nr:minor capsid protein [Eubacterium limosum]
MSKTRVKINMDPHHKILTKRGMNKGGQLQKEFLTEMRRHTDKYVPMQTGHQKNIARIVTSRGELIYPGPKARYLYYGKVMEGKPPKKVTNRKLQYNGAPMRGAFWATRSWADNGDDILRTLAALAGGKVK